MRLTSIRRPMSRWSSQSSGLPDAKDPGGVCNTILGADVGELSGTVSSATLHRLTHGAPLVDMIAETHRCVFGGAASPMAPVKV